ncbi:MAG: hypothetical protein GEV05_26945 [Betaproteobacteria bacterium]|nr:hypothetical protein [Betaproteobacteria bacterium]
MRVAVSRAPGVQAAPAWITLTFIATFAGPSAVLHAVGGTDTSGQFDNATDIMCGTRGLVIATIYRQRSSAADALRRAMNAVP